MNRSQPCRPPTLQEHHKKLRQITKRQQSVKHFAYLTRSLHKTSALPTPAGVHTSLFHAVPEQQIRRKRDKNEWNRTLTCAISRRSSDNSIATFEILQLSTAHRFQSYAKHRLFLTNGPLKNQQYTWWNKKCTKKLNQLAARHQSPPIPSSKKQFLALSCALAGRHKNSLLLPGGWMVQRPNRCIISFFVIARNTNALPVYDIEKEYLEVH